MFRLIEGKSADEVWRSAAILMADRSIAKSVSSRAGNTTEILRAAISIENPLDRWITSRAPALNVAFVLAEVIWIMGGRRDSRFLNYWNSNLPKYQGDGVTYHGAYGYRLRHQFTFDQLDRAYCSLKSDNETRQVVLQIWNSETDFPSDGGAPASRDVPCNIISMIKIRENKLEWTQILRSNDLILGVPHNFVQFTYLQEILAGWLGIDVGTYNHLADSLHIYDHQFESISNIAVVDPEPNNDRFTSSRYESELLFTDLSTFADRLISTNIPKSELLEISDWPEAPKEFKNILLVLAAESARRRKWTDIFTKIMDECTNPCFNQMWKRWLQRMSDNRPK